METLFSQIDPSEMGDIESVDTFCRWVEKTIGS
jgi:hypothetical protein